MVSKVVHDICYFILPLHLKADWPLENGQQYSVTCGCHTLLVHSYALEGIIVPFHARVLAWSIIGISHSCHRAGYSCSRHKINSRVTCKNITFSLLANVWASHLFCGSVWSLIINWFLQSLRNTTAGYEIPLPSLHLFYTGMLTAVFSKHYAGIQPHNLC